VSATRPTPLQPREFFTPPWSGTGRWTPRAAISPFAPARRFAFRTFTTFLSDELWLIHDETAWEDGRVERRDGMAVLLAPDRFRLTYDGMPGGAEITLRADGFEASPYSLSVDVHPLPLSMTVRCTDACSLRPDGELVDVIDVALLGVRLGRVTMSLRAETG
jgi:hypothetical protein